MADQIIPPPPTAPRSTSPDGVGFLQRHEGFRSQLYNDATGNATIGYGHLVHRGPVGSDPRAEAIYASGISTVVGVALLARDLRIAEAAVRVGIVVPLTQFQFDALVSLTFNIGVTRFQGSTLRRRINLREDDAAIREAFMMWDKPASIIGRRTDEANLYLTGRYHGTP